MDGFLVCLFIVGIPVAIFLLSRRRKKKIAQRKAQEIQSYLNQINKAGRLPTIQTSIYLKEKEEAYLQEVCSLYETRSFRRSGGGAIRIAKGVYIGGGESHYHQRLTQIDTGKLVLTNKRLIFDGQQADRTLSLDKLLSIEAYRDGLEVSIEGKTKSQFYKVRNSLLWKTVIQIIKGKESGEGSFTVKL